MANLLDRLPKSPILYIFVSLTAKVILYETQGRVTFLRLWRHGYWF